jgi:hypothetical protein
MRIKMYTLIPTRGRAEGVLNTLKLYPTERWTLIERTDVANPIHTCHVFEDDGEQDLFEELLNVLWEQCALLTYPTANQIY